MPDVSIFKLGGQNINVKDATDRSTAQSASTTATEAASTANQALQLAQEIEQLSRVTITTATHEGG